MDSIKNTGFDYNMNRMMKAFTLLMVVVVQLAAVNTTFSHISDNNFDNNRDLISGQSLKVKFFARKLVTKPGSDGENASTTQVQFQEEEKTKESTTDEAEVEKDRSMANKLNELLLEESACTSPSFSGESSDMDPKDKNKLNELIKDYQTALEQSKELLSSNPFEQVADEDSLTEAQVEKIIGDYNERLDASLENKYRKFTEIQVFLFVLDEAALDYFDEVVEYIEKNESDSSSSLIEQVKEEILSGEKTRKAPKRELKAENDMRKTKRHDISDNL